MKHNEISELSKLEHAQLQKIFNVYQTNSGEYYYNILNTVNFNTEDVASYMYFAYQVVSEEPYTIISYKHYRTIHLWWLIAAFNGVTDPTQFPAPGSTLKILYSKYLPDILTQINSI